jgi:putative ABC transport system substrate-binding protein
VRNGHLPARRLRSSGTWRKIGSVPIPSRVAIAVGLLVAGLGLPVGAQQPGKLHRIGYVSPAAPPQGPSPSWTAFLEGLRQEGFVEGTHVTIERRYSSGGGAARAQELLRELAAMNTDVFVTVSTLVAQEAKKTIKDRPIVMAASTDPVGGGVVESLARPGGNITGFSFTGVDVTAKRLELLKTLAPDVTSVLILVPTRVAIYELHRQQAEAAAPGLGIRAVSLEAIGSDPATWDDVFRRLARPGTGLLISDSPPIWRHRDRVAELVRKYRLPAVHDLREYIDAGSLVAYGPDVVDVFRRTGRLVGRVLKGANPAEIPVEQPTRFDLVVNARTAGMLGLTVPPSLRLRADQVLE